MLSMGQAADRFHVHPNTLKRWCEEGKIASHLTFNGERLISEREIEQRLCEAYQNISTGGSLFSFCRVS